MGSNILPELPVEEVKKIEQSYKNLYQDVTSILNVRVLEHRSDDTKIVISQWRQRNLITGSWMKTQRSMVVNKSFETAVNVDSIDSSNCVLSAFSLSESMKASISINRTDVNTASNENDKFILDIWNEQKLIATFNLTELNIHGSVYVDEIFGALSWSNQEDKIIYVAEKKPPKTVPFYSQKTDTAEKQYLVKDNGEPLKGEQYVFEEDWGEGISPKKNSVVVVCNITDKKLEFYDESSVDFSPGQVIWEPSGVGIVGVGFFHKPRRLGVKFCFNRRSCIFYLTKGGKYDILSADEMSVSSPRFSPDGKHLIWLQHPHGGPHNSAFALVKCDWKTKNISIIINLVSSFTRTTNNYKFYGIYCSQLPTRCWTSDSKYIVFSTHQTYRINSYAVNIDDGSLWDIGSHCENESTIIFDVTENNFAVGEKTSFKQPSILAAVNIMSMIANNPDYPDRILWNDLTYCENSDNVNDIECFAVRDEVSDRCCYAVYYGPKSVEPKSIPVVLFIHGGPHTSASSIYYPSLHFFTLQGFGVIITNYTGSLGCGNDYVHALLGNIGSLDVADCYLTLQNSFKKFPWLDSNNVMLFGGSHGGFLVTHLSSRYPNAFKAVVARNPAVNIPTKIFISDIPDWNTTECGYPYEGVADIMTNENLWRKMADCSPMRYVKNVKTPTLLLLGKNDVRVPYLPALSYYNALKELNIPTKALVFADNHSLSSVIAEMNSIINSMIWFKRCMILDV